jgi:hypothetical protein
VRRAGLFVFSAPEGGRVRYRRYNVALDRMNH